LHKASIVGEKTVRVWKNLFTSGKYLSEIQGRGDVFFWRVKSRGSRKGGRLKGIFGVASVPLSGGFTEEGFNFHKHKDRPKRTEEYRGG